MVRNFQVFARWTVAAHVIRAKLSLDRPEALADDLGVLLGAQEVQVCPYGPGQAHVNAAPMQARDLAGCTVYNLIIEKGNVRRENEPLKGKHFTRPLSESERGDAAGK